jgi:methionyl-tRNA formyltransferase
VRGLSPYPCAFFNHNGKSYKVFKTKIVEGGQWSMVSGQLSIKSNATNNSQHSTNKIYQTKKEIYIQTNKGVLQILELQLEDRKRMTVEEFLRGYTLVK